MEGIKRSKNALSVSFNRKEEVLSRCHVPSALGLV